MKISSALLLALGAGPLTTIHVTVEATTSSGGNGAPSFGTRHHLPAQSFLLKFRGGSPLVIAKGEEESQTSKVDVAITEKLRLDEQDAPLLTDIELLSDILSETVKRENQRTYDLYNKFREYGLKRYVDTCLFWVFALELVEKVLVFEYLSIYLSHKIDCMFLHVQQNWTLQQ